MTGRRIDVPVPGVVVLIGAAGAGKTTLASRAFGPDEVLSSDDLRAAVRGDAADQSATRTAFAILHRELLRRLSAGRLVVVDATSLTVASRTAILRRAALARVTTIAIVLLPSPGTVHARNASRPGRSVPADVVDRQLAAAAALGADPAAVRSRLLAEGFAAVHVLAGDASDLVASVAIRRRPARVGGAASAGGR
jgi:predicted kinase